MTLLLFFVALGLQSGLHCWRVAAVRRQAFKRGFFVGHAKGWADAMEEAQKIVRRTTMDGGEDEAFGRVISKNEDGSYNILIGGEDQMSADLERLVREVERGEG